MPRESSNQVYAFTAPSLRTLNMEATCPTCLGKVDQDAQVFVVDHDGMIDVWHIGCVVQRLLNRRGQQNAETVALTARERDLLSNAAMLAREDFARAILNVRELVPAFAQDWQLDQDALTSAIQKLGEM